MKLYIKHRSVSFKDKFGIYNEEENIVFHVAREFFTIGAKAYIYDTDRQEKYMIKSKQSHGKKLFEIYKDGKVCATVSREFSIFKHKLKVESDLGPLNITGNFIRRDYDVTLNGELYGSIHRKLLPWADSYEITVPKDENVGLLCALMVSIELILVTSKGKGFHTNNHNA